MSYPRGQPGTGVAGTVYLLHFEPAFHHAQHYVGWTDDLHARVDKHLAGNGAKLVAAAVAAGCHVELVRTWEGVDRHFERSLKITSHKRLCPKCRPDYLARNRERQRKRRER